MLFKKFARKDRTPKMHAESLYTFLNRFPGREFSEFRRLLGTWYLRYPKRHQKQLETRFCSDDNSIHISAFYELWMHEILLRMDYQIEVHPEISGTQTRPEFLALRNGVPLFYVECTLAEGPKADAAASKRLDVIYDTINRTNSPNFFLEVEVQKYTTTPPSGAKWRTILEKKLSELDPDDPLFNSLGKDPFPRWTLKDKGWEVIFVAIPKSPEDRGKKGTRPIGVTWMGATWVKDHIRIRNSIFSKASKYGDLEIPFIIAVNLLSYFCDDIHVQEALFGDEIVRVFRKSNGSYGHELARKRNGAWIGHKGPQYKGVSGVLISENQLWGNIASANPVLWHNPWARNPLPTDYWFLSQKQVDLSNGRLISVGGKRAFGVFGLREDWPATDESS